MVGMVLVSHNPEIAEGTSKLICGMAEEIGVAAVGGDSDGSLGTDPDRIRAAIQGLTADEVLVFRDIGSAMLSAGIVVEMLEPGVAWKVRLVDAPFVEGAMEARTEPKLHDEE